MEGDVDGTTKQLDGRRRSRRQGTTDLAATPRSASRTRNGRADRGATTTAAVTTRAPMIGGRERPRRLNIRRPSTLTLRTSRMHTIGAKATGARATSEPRLGDGRDGRKRASTESYVTTRLRSARRRPSSALPSGPRFRPLRRRTSGSVTRVTLSSNEPGRWQPMQPIAFSRQPVRSRTSRRAQPTRPSRSGGDRRARRRRRNLSRVQLATTQVLDCGGAKRLR